MAKVNVDQSLYDQAKKTADATGYSSVDEFIAHCIENELKKVRVNEAEEKVSNQLRGLGYIE